MIVIATLKQAKTDDELKKLTVTNVKKAYSELASYYNKIIDGELLLCGKCNDFYSKSAFYTDHNYKSGYFPICKKCVFAMVEQRNKKNDEARETKASVQKVLRLMDLPYIDSLYESSIATVQNDIGEKNRTSPFLHYITCLKSLPNWKGRTWDDSEFEEDTENAEALSKRKPRKEIIKLFGSGYSNEDYLYLQDQYDDWRTRTQIDSKSQETYIVRICCKLLDIRKAQQKGIETDKLDKSLNELMASANLQPRQNVTNASTDALTFGQLIEKWENEEPIPEPSEDFKDVDNIGRYIDVFFKGHLAKAMGLKNGYSQLYDDYMKPYTASKPEYGEDGVSDAIFNSLFGKEVE